MEKKPMKRMKSQGGIINEDGRSPPAQNKNSNEHKDITRGIHQDVVRM